MLAVDLATLYVTSAKVLKQSVRRKINRFHKRFMFEATKMELERLRSQFVNSKRGGLP